MSHLRLVVLTALTAGTIGASARGDAILHLGLFSAVGSSSGSGNSAQSSTSTSTNLASSDPTNQSWTTQAPVMTYATPSPVASSSPTPTYDAFINLGNGPFPNSNDLTTGNPLPWYDSSKILGLFGGQPNAQQINAFDSTVLQRVQQTFQLSGVPVSLTDDPTASAAHTLSVVSNASNPSLTGAIGMTNIGGNGFHFIDNSAAYVSSVDQLEWIVAHNVAHELMLAFGVPEDHDQTGKYIDSTVGQMAMFLNPQSTFSSGAAQDLLSRNFLQSNSTLALPQAQLVDASPVPEPATLVIWSLGAVALIAARRKLARIG